METQKYIALGSQNGEGDPVIQILENSLGVTSDWEREASGFYTLTELGKFPPARTALSIGSVFPDDDGSIAFADLQQLDAGDKLVITTNTRFVDDGDIRGADNSLKLTRIAIEVYPEPE